MDDLVARDRGTTVTRERVQRLGLARSDAAGDRDSDRAGHFSGVEASGSAAGAASASGSAASSDASSAGATPAPVASASADGVSSTATSTAGASGAASSTSGSYAHARR